MENGFADEPSWSPMNGSHDPPRSLIKVFTCKYCFRKFLNSRAFGGHQNAHKKERRISKVAQPQLEMGMVALDLNRPAPEELSSAAQVLKISAGVAAGDHVVSNWAGTSYMLHPFNNYNYSYNYSYLEANKGPPDASSSYGHHQQPDLTNNLDLNLHL